MIGWWWVWQNYSGTVILLKFQSVANFAKITEVHPNSANRTAKPHMHYSNQAKFVVL
jgi:hypothetical protein